MKTIRLREWTTTPALSLTALQRDVLRTVLHATVQPTAHALDRFDVTPGNIIGAVQADETTLLVEPKIPIARVLFLLSYSTWVPKGTWRDASVGSVPDLVSSVVGLFTTLAESALRRGLLTGYHQDEADLFHVHGRIDITEQLRRRPGRDLPLALRFDEHDEDVIENQLLFAAANILRGLPIRDRAARRSLHRITERLRGVSPVAFPPAAVPVVNWTRLNAHYGAAVEFARLLLQMRSPDIAVGAVTMPSLVIDMAMVFETFVREALRDALGASPAQFPAGQHCPELALDSRRCIRLRPDLSYWPRGECVFVGDVKYKRDSGPGHHDDLYQLLAYATATRLSEASLVYAHGPSSSKDHHVPGAGVRLRVEHLNLAVPPAQILGQVSVLADEIKSHAASPMARPAVI